MTGNYISHSHFYYAICSFEGETWEREKAREREREREIEIDRERETLTYYGHC